MCTVLHICVSSQAVHRSCRYRKKKNSKSCTISHKKRTNSKTVRAPASGSQAPFPTAEGRPGGGMASFVQNQCASIAHSQQDTWKHANPPGTALSVHVFQNRRITLTHEPPAHQPPIPPAKSRPGGGMASFVQNQCASITHSQQDTWKHAKRPEVAFPVHEFQKRRNHTIPPSPGPCPLSRRPKAGLQAFHL